LTVRRFGKGEEQQKVADKRRRAHHRWVNAQLQRAQEVRDWKHKSEVRAFFAEQRRPKTAEERLNGRSK